MQKEIYGESCFNYLASFPKNYDANRKYPLVLFLHGAGERGDDLSILTRTGIPKIFAGEVAYEAIVVSPQCPEGKSWNSFPHKLFEFLQYVIRKYKVEEKAISITGLSLGGSGTWLMVTEYPEMFSAAAPICGVRPPLVNRAANVPICIYHGEKDDIVDVAQSKEAYKLLRSANAKEVELFLYPECDHDSWTKAYEETDLIDWLIGKRK